MNALNIHEEMGTGNNTYRHEELETYMRGVKKSPNPAGGKFYLTSEKS